MSKVASKRIITVGRPTHFRPTNANKSACGIECPELAAYDGRDVDCLKCRKTAAWKRQVGQIKTTGYTAKASNLAELVLFENFIDQHAKEIKERAEYLERIAKGVARVRAEIRANDQAQRAEAAKE